MAETDDPAPAGGRRRRLVLGGAAVAALALLGLAWFTWTWIVSPTTEVPESADAIVVLGGGGPRTERGVELAAAGVADTVVFSAPFAHAAGWYSVGYCNGEPFPVEGVELVCFDPAPPTTRGEARSGADLATERGWDHLVVVGSTDQLSRARMLFDRCWDGTLSMDGVTHDQSLPRRIVYEWGALAKALVNPGC